MTGSWGHGFEITRCPRCGEPPRVVVGDFRVFVDLATGKILSLVGRAVKRGHEFKCGGGHQWPAEREAEEHGD